MTEDEKTLRYLLATTYTSLYNLTFDPKAETLIDATDTPKIDFYKDSPLEIQRKMKERHDKALRYLR